MKCAVVVPIHRKNDKNDKSNYRPVSPLSSISKVYETAFEFSSKAVVKIIAEAEVKKTFASAIPRQCFCQRNQTNLCIYLGNSLGSLGMLLQQCCFIYEPGVNETQN